MEFIRYLSLLGMLLWSLVHILISPHFLEKEMYIHAAVIIGWGEVLLIIANNAASGTWFEKKIVSINAIYALLYLLLSYMFYTGNYNDYVSLTLFIVGIIKLFTSLIYRDDWSTIILFILCVVTGSIQTVVLLSSQPTLPYSNIFPFLNHQLIPVSIDIIIFWIAAYLALKIVSENILPSVFVLSLFLIFGVGLIGAGTWSAYVGLSWIISGLILGKGVVSISLPAFKR